MGPGVREDNLVDLYKIALATSTKADDTLKKQ